MFAIELVAGFPSLTEPFDFLASSEKVAEDGDAESVDPATHRVAQLLAFQPGGPALDPQGPDYPQRCS